MSGAKPIQLNGAHVEVSGHGVWICLQQSQYFPIIGLLSPNISESKNNGNES